MGCNRSEFLVPKIERPNKNKYKETFKKLNIVEYDEFFEDIFLSFSKIKALNS